MSARGLAERVQGRYRLTEQGRAVHLSFANLALGGSFFTMHQCLLELVLVTTMTSDAAAADWYSGVRHGLALGLIILFSCASYALVRWAKYRFRDRKE